MTNSAFKNALIGGKGSLDASWPSLNESNNIKKLYTNCQNHLIKSQNSYVKKGSSVIFSGVTPSSQCVESEITESISSSEKVQVLKEEFPDLCKTLFSKKNSTTTEKKYAYHNEVLPHSIPKNCFRYTYKHAKLKKDAVSVPLLSLVKVPQVKKKLPTKRKKFSQNVLCGNKLDSDQPVRRKGKVRLQNKKFESKIKKEISVSKKLKTRKIGYTQNILRAKCLIPPLMCHQNEISTEKLVELLSSINIDNNESQDNNVKNKNSPLFSRNQEGINELLPKIWAKNILHSQAFKEYCNNIVDSSLLKSIETLIVTLRNFQDRLHAKEPVKAFAKRRLLCGFKESKKFLLADKVKLLIVATNLQIDLELPSGRVLKEIKSLAEEREVPLIFAGRGNQIGYWTLKRRRISIVSILNYEGAEDLFKNVIINWNDCSKMYKSTLEEIENYLLKHNPSESVEPTKKVEEEIREKILSKLSLDVVEKDCFAENV